MFPHAFHIINGKETNKQVKYCEYFYPDHLYEFTNQHILMQEIICTSVFSVNSSTLSLSLSQNLRISQPSWNHKKHQMTMTSKQCITWRHGTQTKAVTVQSKAYITSSSVILSVPQTTVTTERMLYFGNFVNLVKFTSQIKKSL